MSGCCGKKMTVRVRFFAYFRELFGGKERIFDLDTGTTIGRFLELLGDTPGRRAGLFVAGAAGRTPALKTHVVVMINGENFSSRGGLAAGLRDGDTVAVFPLMGGG